MRGRHRLRLTVKQKIAVVVAALAIAIGGPVGVLAVTGSTAEAATGAVDDYPPQWRNVPQDSVYDSWRELNRECTSFVAWRLHSRNRYETPFFADAGGWRDKARALKVRVDGTPAPGAVAWTPAHVAWVLSAGAGTVTIEEYNHVPGRYSTRTVAASTFQYLHFKDLPTTPGGLPAAQYRAAFDKAEPLGGGRVHVSGWVIDTDTAASTQAHVYGGSGLPGGGNPGVALTAANTRNDVANAYRGYGAAHGFDGVLQARAGRQTVCLYGINVPGTPGANQKLICRTVDVR